MFSHYNTSAGEKFYFITPSSLSDTHWDAEQLQNSILLNSVDVNAPSIVHPRLNIGKEYILLQFAAQFEATGNEYFYQLIDGIYTYTHIPEFVLLNGENCRSLTSFVIQGTFCFKTDDSHFVHSKISIAFIRHSYLPCPSFVFFSFQIAKVNILMFPPS